MLRPIRARLVRMTSGAPLLKAVAAYPSLVRKHRRQRPGRPFLGLLRRLKSNSQPSPEILHYGFHCFLPQSLPGVKLLQTYLSPSN